MPDNHTVTFIDDDELPPEHDWALLKAGGKTHLVVKRSRVCPGVLTDAWAGYRELAQISA